MEVPSPKGGRTHMTKENTIILKYENDILNGTYSNPADGTTIFIPQHSVTDIQRVGDKVEERMLKEGANIVEIGEVDYDQYPHSEVVELVGQVIVKDAIYACWKAAEELEGDGGES